jgi:hypothetical protein
MGRNRNWCRDGGLLGLKTTLPNVSLCDGITIDTCGEHRVIEKAKWPLRDRDRAWPLYSGGPTRWRVTVLLPIEGSQGGAVIYDFCTPSPVWRFAARAFTFGTCQASLENATQAGRLANSARS